MSIRTKREIRRQAAEAIRAIIEAAQRLTAAETLLSENLPKPSQGEEIYPAGDGTDD